jgi:copper chaperone NosL
MTRGAGLQWRGVTIGLAFCLLGVLLASLAGAAEKGIPKPTARDKCPVCGMFVAKYSDWTMVVIFKDVFKYLFNMKRYDPAKKEGDVQAIMVKDYYRLTFMDARKAWFVLGSDVYGPMGKELIPLEKESDAKEFMKDHQGKRILRFPDVTMEVIKTLD